MPQRQVRRNPPRDENANVREEDPAVEGIAIVNPPADPIDPALVKDFGRD